jgi:hypothetical protein
LVQHGGHDDPIVGGMEENRIREAMQQHSPERSVHDGESQRTLLREQQRLIRPPDEVIRQIT